MPDALAFPMLAQGFRGLAHRSLIAYPRLLGRWVSRFACFGGCAAPAYSIKGLLLISSIHITSSQQKTSRALFWGLGGTRMPRVAMISYAVPLLCAAASLCAAMLLLCAAPPRSAFALPCVAPLGWAFAGLCPALPSLAFAVSCSAWPCLRYALFGWALPLLCRAVPCLAMPCLCRAGPCSSELCTAFALPSSARPRLAKPRYRAVNS